MSATPTQRLPFKECGTPDAIWGADVHARRVRFDVNFPVPLIAPQEGNDFIAEMHAAMLPVTSAAIWSVDRPFAICVVVSAAACAVVSDAA